MKQLKQYRRFFLAEAGNNFNNERIDELIDLYGLSDLEFSISYFDEIQSFYKDVLNSYISQSQTVSFKDYFEDVTAKRITGSLLIEFTDDGILFKTKTCKKVEISKNFNELTEKYGINFFNRLPFCSSSDGTIEMFEDELSFMTVCALMKGFSQFYKDEYVFEKLFETQLCKSVCTLMMHDYEEIVSAINVLKADRRNGDYILAQYWLEVFETLASIPEKTYEFLNNTKPLNASLTNDYCENTCSYNSLDFNGNVICHAPYEKWYEGNSKRDYEEIEFELEYEEFCVEIFPFLDEWG